MDDPGLAVPTEPSLSSRGSEWEGACADVGQTSRDSSLGTGLGRPAGFAASDDPRTSTACCTLGLPRPPREQSELHGQVHSPAAWLTLQVLTSLKQRPPFHNNSTLRSVSQEETQHRAHSPGTPTLLCRRSNYSSECAADGRGLNVENLTKCDYGGKWYLTHKCMN